MNTPELDDDGDPELEGGREVVNLYELPALFVKEGTDNAPTTRPIVWAYVWKKQGASLGFIDFHPIEEMADLDQLRDAYGAGVYQVQGRGANKKDTVKQVTLTIGGAVRSAEVMQHTAPSRAEIDFAKLATAAVTVVTPLLALWQSIQDKRDERDRERRDDERVHRADERTREDARSNAFMESMTKLMGARMTDLEALLKAQTAAAAGGVGGSGGGNKIVEAYNTGQADTLELIRAIKEDGLAGEDLESRLVGLFEAFAVGKNKAKEEIAESEAHHANGKGQA